MWRQNFEQQHDLQPHTTAQLVPRKQSLPASAAGPAAARCSRSWSLRPPPRLSPAAGTRRAAWPPRRPPAAAPPCCWRSLAGRRRRGGRRCRRWRSAPARAPACASCRHRAEWQHRRCIMQSEGSTFCVLATGRRQRWRRRQRRRRWHTPEAHLALPTSSSATSVSMGIAEGRVGLQGPRCSSIACRLHFTANPRRPACPRYQCRMPRNRSATWEGVGGEESTRPRQVST